MSSSTPIDRRTVLKGAAWAAPVIVLATAAPAAAASPAPPAYSGPAFVVIGAGAGANNATTKIYAIGDGPTRGTSSLAPGVRFGWIAPTASKPVSVQSAVVTFTPLSAGPTPTAETLFEKFNSLSFTPTTAPAGSFAFSIRVDPAASDPRAGFAGVISFTVRTNAANRGTYKIVGENGRTAQFEIRSFDTAANATHLTSQTSY